MIRVVNLKNYVERNGEILFKIDRTSPEVIHFIWKKKVKGMKFVKNMKSILIERLGRRGVLEIIWY